MIANAVPKKDQELQGYILALDNPEKKSLVDLANAIAPENKFSVLENLHGLELDRAKISSMYGDKYKIVTLDEIKEDCIKYNQAFIRSSDFKGEFSLELMEKIKKFVTENPQQAGFATDFRYKYFLLGERFNKSDERTVYMDKSAVDPLIFFRHSTNGGNDEHDFYILVDGNKEYTNVSNAIWGFKFKNAASNLVFTFLWALVHIVVGYFLYKIVMYYLPDQKDEASLRVAFKVILALAYGIWSLFSSLYQICEKHTNETRYKSFRL